MSLEWRGGATGRLDLQWEKWPPAAQRDVDEALAHLVFYMKGRDHIDVWRVLHSRRDIPAWMQQP